MNDDRFLHLIEETGFDNEAVTSPEETIIGLFADFSIAFFNQGWFRFAQENDGEPEISKNWRPGRNVFDCIPEELADFYRTAYCKCLETGNPWGHEYECSSPDTLRLLHQQVYPLRQQKGLLVIHSTITTRPIEEEVDDYTLDDFINPDGFLVQCCHCRKFKKSKNGSGWIWRGDLVRSLPENISHGFCNRCRDFHYPRDRKRRQRIRPPSEWTPPE